jgi:YggT family protein
MERHESNVVREESDGMVREESRVTTSGAGAPLADDDTEIVSRTSPARRAVDVIYLVFGLITALLVIRLVLKVIGAYASAPFVGFIYNVTNFFLEPFKGLLPAMVNGRSVLEPAVLIAIGVYLLVAFLLAKIVELILSRSVTVAHRSRRRDFRPNSD